LACASGRQSIILVSHTCIESSIYILLIVSLLASLFACKGGGIPWGLYKLQGGDRHVHHLRPHVCYQPRQGEGLVNRLDCRMRRRARGSLPSFPLPLDCLHPSAGQLIPVHVVDDVRIHRAVPDEAAILSFGAVQSVHVVKTSCPVCVVKAPCPLPCQFGLL
jgi:hypothetical protein